MTHPKIHKIGDIGHIRMLLTATSGFGKTVFGTTAPRTLLLLTDPEGSYSALRFGNQDNAEEWTCTHANDLQEAYNYLAGGGVENYDWVVIDNISHAQKLFRKKAKEDNIARSPRTDPLVPEPGDYLRDQLSTEKLVQQMHELPVNILWTAWQEVRENELTGDVYYMPNIHGQKGAVAEQIMGYMNINGFGKVIQKDGKDVRRIYFSQKDPYRGKDRFVALGEYQDNLNLPKMAKIIEEAKKSGAAATSKPTPKKRTATNRRVATKK